MVPDIEARPLFRIAQDVVGLGDLPEPGERILVGDLVFEVVSMSGRNIDRIRVAPARAD